MTSIEFFWFFESFNIIFIKYFNIFSLSLTRKKIIYPIICNYLIFVFLIRLITFLFKSTFSIYACLVIKCWFMSSLTILGYKTGRGFFLILVGNFSNAFNTSWAVILCSFTFAAIILLGSLARATQVEKIRINSFIIWPNA